MGPGFQNNMKKVTNIGFWYFQKDDNSDKKGKSSMLPKIQVSNVQ